MTTENVYSELRRCRFCGGRSHFMMERIIRYQWATDRYAVYVVCNKCGASSRRFYYLAGEASKDDMKKHYASEMSKAGKIAFDRAEKAWNDRASFRPKFDMFFKCRPQR